MLVEPDWGLQLRNSLSESSFPPVRGQSTVVWVLSQGGTLMPCYNQFIYTLGSFPPPRLPKRWRRAGRDPQPSSWLSFLPGMPPLRSVSCSRHAPCPPAWWAAAAQPAWLCLPLPPTSRGPPRASVLACLCLPALPDQPSGAVAAGPQLCGARGLARTPLGCPVGILNTSRPKSAQSASVHTEPSLQVADPIFRCPGEFLGGSSFLCGFLRKVFASGFKASPASDHALPPCPAASLVWATASHRWLSWCRSPSAPCAHPGPERRESIEGQPSLPHGLPAAPGSCRCLAAPASASQLFTCQAPSPWAFPQWASRPVLPGLPPPRHFFSPSPCLHSTLWSLMYCSFLILPFSLPGIGTQQAGLYAGFLPDPLIPPGTWWAGSKWTDEKLTQCYVILP